MSDKLGEKNEVSFAWATIYITYVSTLMVQNNALFLYQFPHKTVPLANIQCYKDFKIQSGCSWHLFTISKLEFNFLAILPHCRLKICE